MPFAQKTKTYGSASHILQLKGPNLEHASVSDSV